MLDNFYISILNYYKKRVGRKSITIASVYINILSITLLLLAASFFIAFAKQMNLVVMSNTKLWVLLIALSIGLMFRNWMYYNGKKRTVLNAKLKSKSPSIILLWLLPIAFLGLSYIFFQIK